jgi:hypothetical protein
MRVTYKSFWHVRILVRIIVQFQSDEDMATFAASQHPKDEAAPDGVASPFRVIRELSLAPIMVLEWIADRFDENALDATLPESAGIVFREKESEFFLSAISPNAVLGMDTINASVYGPFQGNGLTIAIIDGGIHAAHPDLEGCTINRKVYSDAASNFDAGHGTAIAGIICGSGRMSRGQFKGIAREVNLLDCVAFDARGKGLLGDILAAIDDAVKKGIRVIAMPFSSRPATETSAIFEYYLRVLFEARATVFCCGAGNHGPLQGTIGMPGCYDCVITTGSTSPGFKVSRFSGRGKQGRANKPDFCLPGEQAVSLNTEDSSFKDAILDENEHYASFSGNSVSVAILTGIVAAILSAKPDAKPAAIKHLLLASCAKIRKSAPISAGRGIIAPASIFRNMDLLYAFAKGFPTISREAAYTTAVVVFFSFATALMIASFL